MENEEVIKKIVQSDFEEIQMNEKMTENIMSKIDNLPKKVLLPLVTSAVWVRILLITGCIFFALILIESKTIIKLDFPGLTKSIGLFLSELTLPLIGVIAAVILIIFDRLLGKRFLRFK